jgi:hypothetical protein
MPSERSCGEYSTPEPAEHSAGGDGPQRTFCGRCESIPVARASAWALDVEDTDRKVLSRPSLEGRKR